LEKPLTEIEKLTLLRDRLIRRRREIVEQLQTASFDQEGGDALARIQNAIDAAVKAIAEEQHAEFRL
jgi:hypothetical protein